MMNQSKLKNITKFEKFDPKGLLYLSEIAYKNYRFDDAIELFKTTNLDAIILGDKLIEKKF